VSGGPEVRRQRPLLTATALHIAELLTGGVSAQRILAIGAYRTAWGPDDVQYVAAWLAYQQRQRASEAECGTESGYKRHRRKHEAVCDLCRDACNAARRRQQATSEPRRREVAAS